MTVPGKSHVQTPASGSFGHHQPGHGRARHRPDRAANPTAAKTPPARVVRPGWRPSSSPPANGPKTPRRCRSPSPRSIKTISISCMSRRSRTWAPSRRPWMSSPAPSGRTRSTSLSGASAISTVRARAAIRACPLTLLRRSMWMAFITPARSVLRGSLFDMSSVDILKGPQGTLVGRNTTGGAILLENNRPDRGHWRLCQGARRGL